MRKIVLLLTLLCTISMADELWSHTQKGKKLYDAGEFELALEQFDSASLVAPSSEEAQFNRALTMAQLGQIGDAKKILESVEFADSSKQVELNYTRGKIADIEGDLAYKEQNINGAKDAYTEALNHYASALALDPSYQQALQNIELTASTIEKLPEPEENEDQDDQQNDENQDENDQEDQNENQNENDDEGDSEKEESDNGDEGDSEDDEDEPEEEENQDQQEDESEEEEENENNQNQDEEEQPQQPEEQSPEQINALQLLERFGDDAKELNRPPEGEALPINEGKDW